MTVTGHEGLQRINVARWQGTGPRGDRQVKSLPSPGLGLRPLHPGGDQTPEAQLSWKKDDHET